MVNLSTQTNQRKENTQENTDQCANAQSYGSDDHRCALRVATATEIEVREIGRSAGTYKVIATRTNVWLMTIARIV